MKKLAAVVFVLVGAALAVDLGCNAILGNERGTLEGSSTGPTCVLGQKLCAGKCLDVSDPAVGCSSQCSACTAPPNSKPGCVLENGSFQCGLGACNDQFADCDTSSSNGCETHTTKRANCGSCSNDCGTEFCVRSGTGTYDCSATCGAPNQECPGEDGGLTECTDPQSDTANCGGCGVNCALANGNGSCENGQCNITCNDNFFHCGDACVPASQAQCGSSCSSCPPGQVCDTGIGSGSYGQCVTTTCVPNDHQCGPMCNIDCTANGEACIGGGCACENSGQTACGCPSQDCTSLPGPGSWACSGPGPACMCGGNVCSGSGVCCPLTDTCLADGGCGSAGVACTPPQVTCPPPCAAFCTGGCIDPSHSPTCGGDCAPANDCADAGLQCCASAAVHFPPTNPTPGTWSCMPPAAGCNP